MTTVESRHHLADEHYRRIRGAEIEAALSRCRRACEEAERKKALDVPYRKTHMIDWRTYSCLKCGMDLCEIDFLKSPCAKSKGKAKP